MPSLKFSRLLVFGTAVVAADAFAADPFPKIAAGVAVVNAAGPELAILDPETLRHVAKIHVAAGPHEVAASPDGLTAYLPLHGRDAPPNSRLPRLSDEIAVVDLAGRKLRTSIHVKPHAAPRGIAVARDGRLWVTCEPDGALLVIDPELREVVGEIGLAGVGVRRVILAPDGRKAYVACGETGVVAVVDTASRTLRGEIKLGRGVDGIAIDPRGKTLYATNPARPELLIVDAVSDRLVRQFPLDAPPGALAVSPDGRTLLVAFPQGDGVGAYDLATLRRRGLVRVRSAVAVLVAADGRSAYAVSASDGSITSFDLESLRILRTATVGKSLDGMAHVGLTGKP